MGEGLAYLVITVALAVILALDAGVWGILIHSFRRSLNHLREASADPGRTVKYSIIIPCRNCSDTIPKVINSISLQTLKPLRVVVVDDGSIDDSIIEAVRAAMHSHVNISIVRLDKVPSGWVPKTYACYIGYLQARSGSEVLLFIDSDTWFTRSDSSLKLVNEAFKYGLASYAPRFTCRTLRCRAIESVLTTFSHALTGFHLVFNPGSKVSWFYGCCWAVRRDVYEVLGTHEAVRNSLVEDRELAVKAKKLGVKFTVIKGFDKVESLWHDSVSGAANALARIFWKSICCNPIKTAVTSLLLTIPYSLPLIGLCAAAALKNVILFTISSIAYAVCSYTHSLGAKLNKYSPIYGIIAPIAGISLIIKFAALASRRRFSWRGRSSDEVMKDAGSPKACMSQV